MSKVKKIIYLDNAATTPVRKEVVLAMKPFWNESFGNPGSITKMGVRARQAVENARRTVAECLKARPQEIVFTSGGTESNNLAVFGLVNHLVSQTRHSSLEKEESKKLSDMHFITTNIEHSSISECFKELERRGGKVDYLKVNEKGLVSSKDLRKLIKPNTVLVSVGYANNEIGVIQPIKEIMKEIRHARKENVISNSVLPYFHTDASQAGLYCNLNINELGVDLMTLDAQKICGPKGVGILFVKAGVEISPIVFGGGQERGLRSGTENVPLIVGMAKAIEACHQTEHTFPLLRRGGVPSLRGGAVERIRKVRDYFWVKIQKQIPEAVLNGDLENRLPNNLNISIPGIDSEFTVFCLDEAGIVCSTRSACNHDEGGSVVVRALYKGLAFEGQAFVRSTLRFSLGENITKKDIDFVVITLKKIVEKQLKSNFI
jgi:cysteine desulfurase